MRLCFKISYKCLAAECSICYTHAMEEKPVSLWSKNFTIITVGSLISMLGSAVAGWAMGLLVYAETENSVAFAAFMVLYSLPRILLPLFVGPYLDRFSRRKVIYTLDFVSAGLYVILFFILYNGLFNYYAFLAGSILIGSIDSVYNVAYESLYPNLIPKGNFRKAYSISSLLYPLSAAVMIPVAGLAYTVSDKGIAFLFLFNAVTFLIAAIFETRIQLDETAITSKGGTTLKRFVQDFREGLAYLKHEKGLLVITAYFFTTMLAYGVTNVLLQPYFYRMAPETIPAPFTTGVLLFTVVSASNTVGRLAGGGIQYFLRYPTDKKFTIAIFIYLAICVLDGGYLFLPNSLWWGMCLMNMLGGILAVNSFNIRVAATQSYVPDAVRGRFNGVFLMINMLGSIAGQLIGGAIGAVVNDQAAVLTLFGTSFQLTVPHVALLVNVFNAICVLTIMLPGRRHVKRIYNVPI